MNAHRRLFSAPAKLNLALRVVGRRADGYHLLQSVMVFFPLHDRLEITLASDGVELVCSPPVTAAPQENLVYRAALALSRESGHTGGARILLTKRIPAGAGLGGGSSDAATTLLALDRMWGLGLGRERLVELGAELGADIPFFLGGRSALVTGVGERLTPLPAFPTAELVLVHPGVELATRLVFRQLAGCFPVHSAPLVPPDAQGDPVAVLENDLEAPALALAPVIGEVIGVLWRAGARGVLMSGSGSSVFGVFPDAVATAAAARRLTGEHPAWRVFTGRFFHDHPFVREWAGEGTG